MTQSLQSLVNHLQEIAPTELAEDWDNIGLLAGDPEAHITRVMTCLTIEERTMQEAIDEKVDLIITHHPLPFRSITKIVGTEPTGYYLWNLIRNGVAVYSPHTAWDNAQRGINQRLAEFLGLSDIRPMIPSQRGPAGCGTGRIGQFRPAVDVLSMQRRLSEHIPHLRWRWNDGALGRPIENLGIVCGSGGSFIAQAAAAGCDSLLTGEVTYHQCLEANARGISLIWVGHYPSERFAMECLAKELASQYPSLNIWASRTESDPVQQSTDI